MLPELLLRSINDDRDGGTRYNIQEANIDGKGAIQGDRSPKDGAKIAVRRGARKQKEWDKENLQCTTYKTVAD